MAFPHLFESNWEEGTLQWDSEQDTGSLCDFPHYSTLSTQLGEVPFRGAYCMRVRPADTNAHTVTEGDHDIADGSTGYNRFYLYVSKDFTATADDTFNIFEWQQAGGTVEASLGFQITAATNLLEIGIGDGAAPTSFVPFTRGRWTCIETALLVSTGGTGTFTLYVDGSSAVALTSQTHAAAIGTAVLGTKNTLSTTTGTLLFDQYVFDDGRIYPISQRYPEEVLLTKSGHVFVGQGTVENVTLLSGAATDCVVSLYDTDQGKTLDASNVKAELKNTTNSEMIDPAGMPANFQRGCYVALSGTNPRAIVKLGHCAAHYSAGRVKQHGAQWKNTPGGW